MTLPLVGHAHSISSADSAVGLLSVLFSVLGLFAASVVLAVGGLLVVELAIGLAVGNGFLKASSL